MGSWRNKIASTERRPQSQTAANPEEDKNDKTIHAQNKQTNVREAQRPAPSSPSEAIRMLKQTEKRGQRAKEDFKTPSALWYKPQSYTELRTTPGPPPWKPGKLLQFSVNNLLSFTSCSVQKEQTVHRRTVWVLVTVSYLPKSH